MLHSLQQRFDVLEARRHALCDELGRLSPEQLAFRPTPAAWSLPQVAQHLFLVEGRVTRVLTERRVSGVTRRGAPDVLRGWLLGAGLFVGMRVRMPVKGVAPDPELPLAQTADNWTATRRILFAYLAAVDEAGTRAIVYRHPIGGHMDLFQTLNFLAKHHDHHLRQVARIRAAPDYPTINPAAAGTAREYAR